MPLRMQSFTVADEPGGSRQLVRVSEASSSSLVTSTVPLELPLTAFRDRMAFSHLFAKYTWAPFWRPFLRTSADEGLKSHISEIDYAATLATALGFMGEAMNNQKMIADGYEMNGKVLRALHAALSSRSKELMARWVFTIVILSLYQYAVEHQLLIPHYYGMAKVIDYCGPECFQQEPMLTCLRQIRAMHSCNSFNHNEPSYFAQEKWKTIPWLLHQKTSHDRLMDVMVDLPGLSSMATSHAAPLTRETKLQLENQTLDIRARLHHWRKDWATANPDAATEVVLPLDADYLPESWIKEMLSRPLQVNTAQQACELIIYNAALVFVNQLLVVWRTGVRQPQPFPDDADESVAKAANDPLYMPEEVKHAWQPSIEGLRILRLAPKLFSRSDVAVMLATSPQGIIYNSLLATEGMGRMFLSMMSAPENFTHLHYELSVFWIK
ncbi:hypothetical protein C8035_v008726 [Colletotrichum spinosum]|uniref:Uncharacterized protein n=1 Tax=Colletotrichum spinosum TaxID=1347390 RepID=A0A4R8PU14_9PEZI|nr:hypothetical protein C8035_v008726 [Colletotrichum spinosum]